MSDHMDEIIENSRRVHAQANRRRAADMERRIEVRETAAALEAVEPIPLEGEG